MNHIKGTTRVCGLIGNPVAHSVSPVIHNTLADLMGIDLVYATFKVNADDIEAAVKGAYALDILGMNVTVPHKQAVMDTLVDIDPLARAIGAVNTLQRVDGGYKGYNTDILGLERELEEEHIDIKGRDVVILGAGGAARSIAFLCAKKEAASVTLLNRTLKNGQDIADSVNNFFKKDVTRAAALASADDLSISDYVVIQTTSVGLFPNVDDVAVPDGVFYEKAAVGVDIIYNPSQTKFMKIMSSHGKAAYNGSKMLLYQGVAAFEIWNGCKVSSADAAKVYRALNIAD